MTFGQAVRTLRGERPRTGIARVALESAPGAPHDPLRHFANYLARIEQDKVPNVGLPTLRLIAKGFGYQSLHEFFERVEALVDGRPGAEPGYAVSVPDPARAAQLSALNLTLLGGFERLGERLTSLIATLEARQSAHDAGARKDGDARPRGPVSARRGTAAL